MNYIRKIKKVINFNRGKKIADGKWTSYKTIIEKKKKNQKRITDLFYAQNIFDRCAFGNHDSVQEEMRNYRVLMVFDYTDNG